MGRHWSLLALLLLAMSVVAPVFATTPPTPAQLAIYARGWIDGAAPPGIYVTNATCTRAHVCTLTLNDGSCARATITAYRFAGPWHHCPKKPTS